MQQERRWLAPRESMMTVVSGSSASSYARIRRVVPQIVPDEKYRSASIRMEQLAGPQAECEVMRDRSWGGGKEV